MSVDMVAKKITWFVNDQYAAGCPINIKNQSLDDITLYPCIILED